MKKLDNLTKDKLISLYINDRKSLEDIAKIYNVSRVAVYKRLKKYDIKQRSKSEARLEAQKQGKLPQQFFDIRALLKTIFSSENLILCFQSHLHFFSTEKPKCVNSANFNNLSRRDCLSKRAFLPEF